MGFFKDLREDISQAVNELLPDDSFWGLGEEAGETVAATESEAVEDVLGGIEPIQEEDLDGTDNLEADEQEILEKLQKFASSEVEDEKKVTQEDWVSGFD